MSYTRAKDISRYQGAFTDTGEEIVMIKMSGGDDGLYVDSEAAQNYAAAVNDGKAVGGYHFGGGVLSAEAEAAFFLKAMSPVAENDVFSLDVEAGLAARADVVQWTEDFIDFFAGHGIPGGLVYMNLATLLAHDWSSPLSKWGLWLADWGVSPDANIPTHYSYVMQQYSDGPNYDHDAFFGTVDQFKAYGWHAGVQQPTPEPVPVIAPGVVVEPQAPPVVEPTPPETTTEPASISTVSSTDSSGTTSITVTTVPSPQPMVVSDPFSVAVLVKSGPSWLGRLFHAIMRMLHKK